MSDSEIFYKECYEAAVAMTQAQIERGYLPSADAVCEFFDKTLNKLTQARGKLTPFDEAERYAGNF